MAENGQIIELRKLSLMNNKHHYSLGFQFQT